MKVSVLYVNFNVAFLIFMTVHSLLQIELSGKIMTQQKQKKLSHV